MLKHNAAIILSLSTMSLSHAATSYIVYTIRIITTATAMHMMLIIELLY